MAEAGTVLAVNKESFDRDVLMSEIPVVVDFWAPWCGPCLRMGPVVEEVASRFAGRVKVVKLNVDENPDLAGEYGVMSIPTLILFRGGQVVDRLVGYRPARELEAWLTGALA
ncbi:MAG: thioredoxin [Limnochordales bacterium]|nr:thioredoxin [Limnochordales bacterium]